MDNELKMAIADSPPSVRAEIERLRKDAERYRAIRTPTWLGWPVAVFDVRDGMDKGLRLPYECVGGSLDALVDAAIKNSKAAA